MSSKKMSKEAKIAKVKKDIREGNTAENFDFLHNLVYSLHKKTEIEMARHHAVSPVAIYSATTSGGSATEEFQACKAKVGMHVLVQMEEEGASPVEVKTAKCSATGKVEIKFSGDPSSDHKLKIFVFRAK